jgi:photosystem II stability/assembly factor-like uncharacterized protein
MKNSISGGAELLRAFPWLFIFTASLFAQSYRVQKSNTTENLRGLSAPSANIAWASGTHGTYLRSMDSGNSWIPAQVPGAAALDFRDVEAFGADLAYLLSAGPGDQSRIYKTSDGGKSWTLQFTNADPGGFFDCMAFWDHDHGIAVGDPVNGSFELITTSDGGGSWRPIPVHSLPPAVPGEGAFAASGGCIAVEGKTNVWFATGGQAARVFRSRDAGRTWSVVNSPIVHGADSAGIFSIAFRDAKHGVIAGGDYQQPEKDAANLAFTDDGGLTWRLSPISAQFYTSAVVWGRATSPAQTERSSAVFAVGSGRAAYIDNISDKSWKKTWALNLNSATYCAPGKAIAVGPNGIVVLFSLIQ